MLKYGVPVAVVVVTPTAAVVHKELVVVVVAMYQPPSQQNQGVHIQYVQPTAAIGAVVLVVKVVMAAHHTFQDIMPGIYVQPVGAAVIVHVMSVVDVMGRLQHLVGMDVILQLYSVIMY